MYLPTCIFIIYLMLLGKIKIISNQILEQKFICNKQGLVRHWICIYNPLFAFMYDNIVIRLIIVNIAHNVVDWL